MITSNMVQKEPSTVDSFDIIKKRGSVRHLGVLLLQSHVRNTDKLEALLPSTYLSRYYL